tara:strand:- start:70008 stop:71294 length:1287 start_codon:yes stop_codon:yes gene_type:complete
MKKKTIVLLICALLITVSRQGIAQEEQALLFPAFQIALENNPNVKAALASIKSAKGKSTQAGLRPNPKAFIEMENFGGNESLSGFDSAEITFGIEQEIEIAGKRTYRQEIAKYGSAIAQQEAFSSILLILAHVHQSYVHFVIAQERLSLAQKRMALSEQTHEAVKSRVSAAAASKIQHTKVDIEQKIAAIDKNKAIENLTSAKSQLEKVLSTHSDSITFSREILSVPFLLPSKDELIAALNSLPQLEIIRLKKLQAKSNINLANAHRITNPTIGGGVRHFKESSSNAFVANFSIPIPIFNRNQGNIVHAQAEYLKVSSEVESEYLILKEMAEKIYGQLISNSSEVRAYRDSIIPSAEKAYHQATQGYHSGRFSFLELIDSQRTLYKIQEAYLNSLLKFHEAKAQVDFILGVNKDLVQDIVSTNHLGQR